MKQAFQQWWPMGRQCVHYSRSRWFCTWLRYGSPIWCHKHFLKCHIVEPVSLLMTWQPPLHY